MSIADLKNPECAVLAKPLQKFRLSSALRYGSAFQNENLIGVVLRRAVER